MLHYNYTTARTSIPNITGKDIYWHNSFSGYWSVQLHKKQYKVLFISHRKRPEETNNEAIFLLYVPTHITSSFFQYLMDKKPSDIATSSD